MTDLTLEEAEALGCRWMACGRFEWQPGMRVRCRGVSCIVIAVDEGGAQLDSGDGKLYGWFDDVGMCPDLRDPGTKGWALEQMRAALDDWTATAEPPDKRRPVAGVRGWYVTGRKGMHSHCLTEAEAIIVAMEGAT